MITLGDYCTRKGQDLRQPYADEWTDEKARSAMTLLNRVNIVMTVFYHRQPGAPRRFVSSGWRPVEVNAEVGGAPGSQHIVARAVDLFDHDARLKEFLSSTFGAKFLEVNELWCEHFDFTPVHVHMQSVPPPSGQRFFRPR